MDLHIQRGKPWRFADNYDGSLFHENAYRRSALGFRLDLGFYMQGEGAMADEDPGEVILTLEMIEQSRYTEYRYTVLAGRIAAIVGVQMLADSAADAASPKALHAGESRHFYSLPEDRSQRNSEKLLLSVLARFRGVHLGASRGKSPRNCILWIVYAQP